MENPSDLQHYHHHRLNPEKEALKATVATGLTWTGAFMLISAGLRKMTGGDWRIGSWEIFDAALWGLLMGGMDGLKAKSEAKEVNHQLDLLEHREEIGQLKQALAQQQARPTVLITGPAHAEHATLADKPVEQQQAVIAG